MNFMEQQKQQFNLPKVMILTGMAFVAGGFFRTLLELLMNHSGQMDSGMQIFLTIWLGFIVEAAVGMAILSYLLRWVYPMRKLWLSGTGAFALGIFITAIMFNQFFYAFMIIPGYLVGLFFGLFLKERSGRKILILMPTLGFLFSQISGYILFNNNRAWVIWLYNNIGNLRVTILGNMVQDMIIGIFIALGFGLMMRRNIQDKSLTQVEEKLNSVNYIKKIIGNVVIIIAVIVAAAVVVIVRANSN
jgi:hypothetical protein